jgi:hypothetical protein
MGAIKRDYEQAVLDRAEELAQKAFGISFDDCTPDICMKLWNIADQDIQERLMAAAEAHSEILQDYRLQIEVAKGAVRNKSKEASPSIPLLRLLT